MMPERMIGQLIRTLLTPLMASIIVTGCANKEADLLASTLTQSANTAKVQVESLQRIHNAQIEAHKTTRDTVGRLIENANDRQRQLAASRLGEAYRDALAKVDEDYHTEITQLRVLRSAANDSLKGAIAQTLQPLQRRADALEEVAQQLIQEEARFPASLELRANRQQAVARYNTVSVTYLELYLSALERGAEALDSAEVETIARLDQARASHRSRLNDIYQKGLVRLQTVVAEKIELGPDPAPASGYTELAAYLDLVSKSGASLSAQNRLNSLGQGSVLDNFLRSFGTGLLGTAGGENGAVTVKDIGEAGNDALSMLVSEVREGLSEASGTAGSAFNDIVSDFITSSTNDAMNKISDIASQARNSANNVPRNGE